MRPEISSLLILQDRDTKILNLTKEIEKTPGLIAAANKRLATDQAKVDQAKATMMDIEKQINTLEIDVATRRTTIERLKVQQFETKKNEEYRALGNEVVRYENEVTELEDQELELMEAAETAKTTLSSARERLKSIESSVTAEIAELNENKTNRESQLAEVQTDRTTKAADVDSTWLALYDRIHARTPPAVVPTAHGTCAGCHMKLVGNDAANARSGEGIPQCSSCGRILYTTD